MSTMWPQQDTEVRYIQYDPHAMNIPLELLDYTREHVAFGSQRNQHPGDPGVLSHPLSSSFNTAHPEAVFVHPAQWAMPHIQFSTGRAEYRGCGFSKRNRRANIAPKQNCRLWITGLPPDCDYHLLLSAIRNVGPVCASHINPPVLHNDPSQRHLDIYTSAASLTFFDKDHANIFLQRHRISPFTISGYRTKIIRHRIWTRSEPIKDRSRILYVFGDPEVANPERLDSLITEWGIRVDYDDIAYIPGPECSYVRIFFGSFWAQALSVYRKLKGFNPEKMTVLYGQDPCAGPA
ncbi:hypothetical protein F4819DRAFT_445891 [Hypoxylon fuscum]|nr:hypothetical protein F4819DRAFT_445891 [Hypoxylon fuscum]